MSGTGAGAERAPLNSYVLAWHSQSPRERTPLSEQEPRTRPNTSGASAYLGGGLPSAYVAGWGDVFIAGAAATPGNERDGVLDGSLAMGIGFGDAVDTVAIELDWNIGSVKNLNFNGGFDASIGRVLINEPNLQLSVGGGWLSFYSYGNEGVDTPNGYGVVTVALPLRPGDEDFPQLLQISAGAGGDSFATIDADFQTQPYGLFAAVGMELTPQLGVSLGWSGRGSNASLSFVPFADLPISVNLLAADLFQQTPYGTIGILSVAWGGSLLGTQ